MNNLKNKIDDVLGDFDTWCMCGSSDCALWENFKNARQTRLKALIDTACVEAEQKLAFTVRQQLGTAVADYGNLEKPDPIKIINAVIDYLDRTNQEKSIDD